MIADEVLKEIVIHIHIKSQTRAKWQITLQQLNISKLLVLMGEQVDKRSFKDLFSSFKDLFSSFMHLLSSRVERSANNNSAFEEVPPFKSFAFTPPPNPNAWLRV
ncbi:hypothetical protein H5410_045909 [Solanum commersonii]|uniref:Uncharacterized protein n=1 Tax=Solanum commersonii TaxID=4109 RepID=A0A9J5XAU8_SOLCO|nr:hypothetical protein H5410_045909 [Solanum commersonii]